MQNTICIFANFIFQVLNSRKFKFEIVNPLVFFLKKKINKYITDKEVPTSVVGTICVGKPIQLSDVGSEALQGPCVSCD
jgi:hypothetical protein